MYYFWFIDFFTRYENSYYNQLGTFYTWTNKACQDIRKKSNIKICNFDIQLFQNQLKKNKSRYLFAPFLLLWNWTFRPNCNRLSIDWRDDQNPKAFGTDCSSEIMLLYSRLDSSSFHWYQYCYCSCCCCYCCYHCYHYYCCCWRWGIAVRISVHRHFQKLDLLSLSRNWSSDKPGKKCAEKKQEIIREILRDMMVKKSKWKYRSQLTVNQSK